jgi:hypothetical protein
MIVNLVELNNRKTEAKQGLAFMEESSKIKQKFLFVTMKIFVRQRQQENVVIMSKLKSGIH